jgi:hydrogenase maturation protease
MNQAVVDQIARAVLYEGYLLDPGRPSGRDRPRGTFGGLCPPSYCLAQQGADACEMQTECLVQGGPATALAVTVRFLHLQARHVGALVGAEAEWPPEGEPPFRLVEVLAVGEEVYHGWEEAVERTVSPGETSLADLAARPRRHDIAFPPTREVEPLRDAEREVQGVLVREQRALRGSVYLSAAALANGLYRVTVRVRNDTPLAGAERAGRQEAMLCSLAAAHAVLGVQGGAFVSLLAPPGEWREAAAGCRNVGAWPVLVGEPGARDTMLAAPIVLYDYPHVAPEVPGELVDAPWKPSPTCSA